MFNFKKLLPKRIFARAIVIIAAPILLLQVAIIYLTLERYWDRVTQQLSAITASEVAVITNQLNQKNLPGLRALGRTLGMEISFAPQAKLPPPIKVPLTDFLHTSLQKQLKDSIQKPIWLDTQTLGNRVDIRIAAQNGVLRVIVPRRRTHAEKTYLLVTWTAAVAIISLAIAILFLRNQVRPIQRLAAVANRFGRGLDVREFKPSGASEVRQAGLAFLNMRARLRRHVAQRTEMLGAISHDLRTALTRLKLQIAFLPENTETDALNKDIAEMEAMINAYLDFARGEGQEERPVRIDIDQMLREITSPIRNHVVLETQPGLVARLRPQALRRCLNNLISNAQAYARNIKISAARNEQGIEIIIDDDGPGISPSQYEEAFRPFHRLDLARNQNIPGSGLGLAIARDIARVAGGDITLAQSPLSGLRVRLFVPA